MWLVH